MPITKEQIFQIADELDAAGQNPTLAAVRKGLEGGSYTTISEAMKEWRATKAADAMPLHEPAPPAVLDRLSEFGTEIWAVALDLAKGRLAKEREELEALRLDLEASRLEAVELADQLATELDISRNHEASLEEVVRKLRAELDALKSGLGTAREQAATAEARNSELERRVGDLRLELDRAHDEAAKNRTLLERLQEVAEKATKDHRAETARLQDELDALKSELGTAREQAATAEACNSELEQRAGDLRVELDRAHDEADKNRKVLERLQAAAEKADKEHRTETARLQDELIKLAKAGHTHNPS